MKITLLISTLLFLTQNAQASKSRLESLSQDNTGSYYLMDNRNIFLNPAHINKVAEGIDLEWGLAGSPTDVDSTANPKAEGGMYKSGKFNYGFI